MPRNRMVRNNTTLAELGTIPTDYPIRVRLKYFELVMRDGSRKVRGPCVSLQQFNPQGHFVSAISVRQDELGKLLDGLLNLATPHQ